MFSNDSHEERHSKEDEFKCKFNVLSHDFHRKKDFIAIFMRSNKMRVSIARNLLRFSKNWDVMIPLLTIKLAGCNQITYFTLQTPFNY